MIKLIIFDFGKVLGSGADPWNENLNVMQNITGLSRLQLNKIFGKHWPQIEIGKKPLINFFQEVSRKSKKPVSPKRLMKTYLSSTTVNTKVLSIVKSLKEKGYTLVILSNESKEKMKVQARNFNLNTLFDKIYCSGEIGISKPNPRIFKHVLKDQKIKPEETLFIDNRDYITEPAKSLGINTILFKNVGRLRGELTNFLSN